MRARIGLAVLAALLAAAPAFAAEGDGSFQSNDRFLEKDGQSIFTHVCAGCHMPDAKGAVGAGHHRARPGTRNFRLRPIPFSW
jgi:mono/diheme cytochrome c family protein